MENAYAEALWKTIVRGTDAKEAVLSLREVLTIRGRQALLPRIEKAFVRIARRESGRTDVTLRIAHKRDEPGALKEAGTALAKMKVRNKEITNIKIDEDLIGGWRLESGEHLVDNSYKKHLLSIYNAATQ